MQIRWLVFLATFVMINLNNRISTGAGGIFVRRVDLTMGERKTKTVSASVKGLCSHRALGPPNSQLCGAIWGHSSVSFLRRSLAISRQFIDGSVCPRTYVGKKQIMMIVSPSPSRSVCREFNVRWGKAFFARRYLYVPRGVFSDGKKWSLVRSGLAALLQ